MNITFKENQHKIQSLQIARFGQIFAKRAVPKIARAEPSRAEKLSARAESELSRVELSSGASLDYFPTLCPIGMNR